MWVIGDLLADILKVLLDIREHLYGSKAGTDYWQHDYFRSTVGQSYTKERERERERRAAR